MENSRARFLSFGLALVSAGCGPHARSPSAASDPSPVRESAADVESSGTKPPGFETSIVSDPKRNTGGVIEATSPVTVTYDACRSRSGDGAPLFFYFDWDFDHVPDVSGIGAACLQKHTYKGPLRTNVCVATADLNRHDPATYVSCRQFTVVVPSVPACLGPSDDSFTGLVVEHETFSPVAGNVFANDCRTEPLLGSFAIEYTNVMNVSFELNGDVHLICPEVGPFSATLYYLTASGRADILLEGQCT